MKNRRSFFKNLLVGAAASTVEVKFEEKSKPLVVGERPGETIIPASNVIFTDYKIHVK